MPEQKAHWFAAKSYGIGWSLPVTWQGCVSVLLFFALLIGGLLRIDEQKARIAYVVTLIIALVIVVAWKGERPFRWRWGRRRSGKARSEPSQAAGASSDGIDWRRTRRHRV